MPATRRRVLEGLMAAPMVIGLSQKARAAADGPVKIGMLSDLSSAYADISGPALVTAARMAAEDFGPCLGKPVEIIAADCQLKPDVSSVIARKWWDTENVDAIGDLPSSAVALAVSQLGREKKKIVLATSPGTAELTGKSCSPYTSQWCHDSYAVAKTMAQATMKQGGDSWFFIAADYIFGASLVTDATAVINSVGGRVVGVARHPLNSNDFSSFILQAQASGAKIIGLANGGNDTVNCIKQAAEFGLQRGGQKLAALVLMDPDVKSIGLELAQGTLAATAFYWDRNDASRAWSRRFHAAVDRMPTMLQAAAYSHVVHYLAAVQKARTKDADMVMQAMRDTPVNDLFATGILRTDGRMVHDMYLAQVKAPSESKEPWDQFRLIATVPGNEAFRALDAGGCPLAGRS